VKRLQHIIEKSVEANGTAVDPSFHKDLVTIMEEKTPKVKKQYPMGSFQSLFWEQQLKTAKAKGPRRMQVSP